MTKQIQAVRGFNDVFPPASDAFNYIEQKIRSLAKQYGYGEMRLPIVEKTELFVRGVGEVTDIVEKEIYVFEDRNGESLTLRPEGTAGCVRAALEHGLLYNQLQRFWYQGPMFRHERPQAGRYRQFTQIGFEAFGMAEAYLDAEMIILTAALWRELGLLDKLELQINTLGTPEVRQSYRAKLIDYFTQHLDQLDEDSKRRLHKNPLRILDSKNPALAEIIMGAPKMLDELDEASRQHFALLQECLHKAGVRFVINPNLVRGLDYYCLTVFEWVSHQLGAQATVCAGGRYDGLVEQLGGKATPAVGFAMGVERLILLLEVNQLLPSSNQKQVYIISQGQAAKLAALQLAEKLRQQTKFSVVYDATETGFKSQFKRADKLGATWALIIGEDELKADTISVKFLRAEMPQQQLNYSAVFDLLTSNS